jgi:hypothetical protein
MPHYILYHYEPDVAPVFQENDIHSISDLKEGDYFIQQRIIYPEYGGEKKTTITRAWNIIRITKKCVYVEEMIGRNYKQFRLKWDGVHIYCWGHDMRFSKFVKQDDMNLEVLMPSLKS